MQPQFAVNEISPSYWRVTFANGPLNLMDADTIDELAALVTRIEEAPALTAVVFGTDNPDYFMAHWDSTADPARVAAMTPGPTGLHPYLDNFVRLSKVPAVTIAAIRGRARGAGSEFVLAMDIRFASDTATLGQLEVAVATVPGGGAMARLARLVGRARAAEILFGGEDVGAELAAAYGYVNRAVPDGELDGFVDAFARRVAGFDKTALAATKALLDAASLPPDEDFAPGLAAFFQMSGRPEGAARGAWLFEHGFQTAAGELDLGRLVGEIPATAGTR